MNNIYAYELNSVIREEIKKKGFVWFIEHVAGSNEVILADMFFIMNKLLAYDSEEMFDAIYNSYDMNLDQFMVENQDLVKDCLHDLDVIDSFISDAVLIFDGNSDIYSPEDIVSVKGYIRQKTYSLISKYCELMPLLINASDDTSSYGIEAANMTADVNFIMLMTKIQKGEI